MSESKSDVVVFARLCIWQRIIDCCLASNGAGMETHTHNTAAVSCSCFFKSTERMTSRRWQEYSGFCCCQLVGRHGLRKIAETKGKPVAVAKNAWTVLCSTDAACMLHLNIIIIIGSEFQNHNSLTLLVSHSLFILYVCPEMPPLLLCSFILIVYAFICVLTAMPSKKMLLNQFVCVSVEHDAGYSRYCFSHFPKANSRPNYYFISFYFIVNVIIIIFLERRTVQWDGWEIAVIENQNRRTLFTDDARFTCNFWSASMDSHISLSTRIFHVTLIPFALGALAIMRGNDGCRHIQIATSDSHARNQNFEHMINIRMGLLEVWTVARKKVIVHVHGTI